MSAGRAGQGRRTDVLVPGGDSTVSTARTVRLRMWDEEVGMQGHTQQTCACVGRGGGHDTDMLALSTRLWGEVGMSGHNIHAMHVWPPPLPLPPRAQSRYTYTHHEHGAVRKGVEAWVGDLGRVPCLPRQGGREGVGHRIVQ